MRKPNHHRLPATHFVHAADVPHVAHVAHIALAPNTFHTHTSKFYNLVTLSRPAYGMASHRSIF